MNYNFGSKKFIFMLCAAIVFSAGTLFHFCFQNDREPAAIEEKSLFSFFNSTGSQKVAFEQDILEGIKIAKNEKNFEINVRNFMVKNTNENLHLCEYFDSYTLTFEAEGIASSGERPTMTINSSCEISVKTNMPTTVVIPVEDIFKLAPSDADISFQVNPHANFSFRNVSDAWPEYWVLSKVEFSNKQFSVRDVTIDRRDIYKLSKKPVTMSWE